MLIVYFVEENETEKERQILSEEMIELLLRKYKFGHFIERSFFTLECNLLTFYI